MTVKAFLEHCIPSGYMLWNGICVCVCVCEVHEGTDCEDGNAHSTTKEERVTLIRKGDRI